MPGLGRVGAPPQDVPTDAQPETAERGRLSGQTPSPPPGAPHHSLRGPILAGLAVRLILAPFTSWQVDAAVWMRSSAAGAYHTGLYARPGFSYPPAFGHVLQALGELLVRLGLPVSSFASLVPALEPLAANGHFSLYVTSPLYNLALKALLCGVDLATAMIVASIVRHLSRDERRARLGFVLVFLNPFVIFASGVMGAFDIVVAFAITLAVYGAIRQRWSLCGAALALGVACKLAPLLLVPILASAALAGAGGRASLSRAALRRLGSLAAGFVAAGAIFVLPELLAGTAGTMASATSLRFGGVARSGGLGFYGLATWRGLESLGRFASGHTPVAEAVSLALTAAAVLVSAVALARGGVTARRLLLATVGCYAVLCLSAPLTQPQYLLWFLPCLAALAAGTGSGRIELGIVSLAPIVIVVFAYGPAALVLPLATGTHLLPTGSVVAAIEHWAGDRGSGVLAVKRTDIPAALATLAAVLVEVRLAWATLRALGRPSPAPAGPAGARVAFDPAPDEPPGTAAPPAERGAPAPRRAAVGLVLGGCLLASVVVAATIGGSAPPGGVRLTSARLGPRTAHVVLATKDGAAQTAFRLVAIPLRDGAAAALQRVLVLSDPLLPGRGGSEADAAAVTAHLRAEFAVRRLPVTVSPVDAAQLPALLANRTSATGTALVDVTGVLPAAVFGPSANRVLPWLRAGGVLVWAGAPLGTYRSTSRDSGAPHPPTRNPSGDRAAALVGCRGGGCLVINQRAPTAAGSSASPMARALGIEFRLVADGVPLRSLPALHGVALGWTGNGLSSVTAVPVGHGAVVVLGGPVLRSDESTGDIATLLASRAYAAAAPPAWTTVGSAGSAAGRVSWTAPLPPTGAGARRTALVAMDPDALGTVFGSWVVSNPSS